MTDQLTHWWRIRATRPDRFASKLRIIQLLGNNAALIEFEDGERIEAQITSLRRLNSFPTGGGGQPGRNLSERVGCCRKLNDQTTQLPGRIGDNRQHPTTSDSNPTDLPLKKPPSFDELSQEEQAICIDAEGSYPLSDRHYYHHNQESSSTKEIRDLRGVEQVVEESKQYLTRVVGFFPNVGELGDALRLGSVEVEDVLEILVDEGYVLRPSQSFGYRISAEGSRDIERRLSARLPESDPAVRPDQKNKGASQ